MVMNVVIVEDEPMTAGLLQEALEKHGCHVAGSFNNGAAVLEFAGENSIDFVVMDVELQGEVNGVDAAIELRRSHNIPSVFITSHNDSSTISRAMEAQPLGYIIKPISVSHVESIVGVVKGLLGKESGTAPKAELQSLGLGYSYNYETQNLFCDGEPVNLTSSELKLFDLCLRRKGTIVPYSVIDEQVWDGKIVSDSTRRGLYHRLRSKLNNNFFETVIGIGCRIQLPEKK
jgi:DNA-binding response OmpR family regulator